MEGWRVIGKEKSDTRNLEKLSKLCKFSYKHFNKDLVLQDL